MFEPKPISRYYIDKYFYIISDERPTSKDWVLDILGNIIIKVDVKVYESDTKRFKKIIKTNNPILFQKKWGVLVRLESAWIGLHYSKSCKRFCLNILPCITIWWIKEGGFAVDLKRM